MINKQEFTKLAKKILHPQPGLREKKYTYPAREWFWGLILTIAIVIACTVWSTQMYFTYQEGSTKDGISLNEPVVVYRESLVKAALEKFSLNQVNFDSLLSDKVEEVPESTPIEIDYSDIDETDDLTIDQENIVSPEPDITIETISTTSPEVNLSPESRPLRGEVQTEVLPALSN
ncbi:MAG: hypothetical protein ACI9BF_000325 [Candidatus Paceibacteria bacterium]|jgi:hypothetical protein